jgi:DNA-binding phage protein
MKSMVDDNPEMGTHMLEDAINAMLQGNLSEGRVHLKEYVSATIGFAELGRRMDKDSKNLMRSLAPRGNPTAENLLAIVQECLAASNTQIAAHITPRVDTAPRPAP